MPRPLRVRALPALLAFAALFALGLALLARPAPADEGPPPVTPDLVEIARIEHVRGDPAGLDRFLAPDADPRARERAILALGRIGDRKGVVPRLRELLRRGGRDEGSVLFAVGLTRSKSLVPDVLPFLDREPEPSDSRVVSRAPLALAIETLGYLGDPRSNGWLRPFLESKEPLLRAEACLALVRTGDERDLKAVSGLLEDPDVSVRRAAAAATWRLAGVRRTARSKPDAPWEGDPDLAARALALVFPARAEVDAETVLYAARAANALLPKTLRRTDAAGAARVDARLLDALATLSPHALADMAFRLSGTHDGDDLVAALAARLGDESPIAREALADGLGVLGTPAAGTALAKRAEVETDERVRRRIAVALAACGDEAAGAKFLAGDDVAVVSARAALLLASKRKEAVADAIAMVRDAKTPPRVRAELLDGLAKKDHEDLAALARAQLEDPDFVVRAQAATLLGKKGGAAAVPHLVGAYLPDGPRDDSDRATSVVEALGKIAAAKETPEDARKAALAVVEKALRDSRAVVRLAARTAAMDLESLAERAKEEDPRPNDWRGLPRPKKPVLDLDLSKGGPWLSEEEVLVLARHVSARAAEVAFETDAGTFRVIPWAALAPAHAANLVLCASEGVYDGTTWHRVVPAFVIQGGDPHGDGSGDAGYSVPDEINPGRFVAGGFGMPKSTKDTGGCQVFAMHLWAPHLDANYTLFGSVSSGQDVVNRVRVGDRIRSARVLTWSDRALPR